jgi:hypothetical protein
MEDPPLENTIIRVEPHSGQKTCSISGKECIRLIILLNLNKWTPPAIKVAKIKSDSKAKGIKIMAIRIQTKSGTDKPKFTHALHQNKLLNKRLRLRLQQLFDAFKRECYVNAALTHIWNEGFDERLRM